MHRHVVTVLVMLCVVLVTMHWSAIWKLAGKDCHHEETSMRDGRLGMRGRKMPWCGPVCRWIPKIGIWQAPPPIPPTKDVCPGRKCWVKGVQLWNLTRLPTAYAPVGHKYRGPSHWPCQLQDPPSERRLLPYTMRSTSWRGPPITVQSDPEAMEEIHQEILTLLKECLQCRWGPTQPEEQEQGLAGMSRSDPQSNFKWRTQVTYDHFQSRQQESHEEALIVARDAHHQALAAAALLEGHIERLSHSVSHGWSGSHGQSGSHWHSCSGRHMRSHRRHPPVKQQEQIPSVVGHPWDSSKRWPPSPRPVRPRRWVTFKESSTGESASVWDIPSQPQLRRHPKEASQQKGILVPHLLLTWILNTS